MAYLDLNKITSMAAVGGYAGYRYLSDETVLTLLSITQTLKRYSFWAGSGYTLTQSEYDDVERIVDTIDYEITQEVTMPAVEKIAEQIYTGETSEIVASWSTPVTPYRKISFICDGLRTGSSEYGGYHTRITINHTQESQLYSQNYLYVSGGNITNADLANDLEYITAWGSVVGRNESIRSGGYIRGEIYPCDVVQPQYICLDVGIRTETPGYSAMGRYDAMLRNPVGLPESIRIVPDPPMTSFVCGIAYQYAPQRIKLSVYGWS